MGTDVHGYVEVNCLETTDQDQWSMVLDIRLVVERNYEIFSLFFGIRENINNNPIAKNRGIPKDCSMRTEFETEDMHGQTWVYLEKIADVLCTIRKLKGWNSVYNIMEILYEQFGEKSTRLVVSFDN